MGKLEFVNLFKVHCRLSRATVVSNRAVGYLMLLVNLTIADSRHLNAKSEHSHC